MHPHTLLNRSDDEVTWFRRRAVLQAAAAWAAGTGLQGVGQTVTRASMLQWQGDVLVNGHPLQPGLPVRPGDALATGPGSQLTLVQGDAALHLRQNSRVIIEGTASNGVLRLLRLISGAVISVWGKGPQRSIEMPTLTAGIRGTGVYAEIVADQDGRNYLCNCYGTVVVQAADRSVLSQADYHQSFWGEVAPRNGRLLTPAKAINHTDEELEFLAQLIGQRTNWQILGRKGVKDGLGYMDDRPGRTHPAAPDGP